MAPRIRREEVEAVRHLLAQTCLQRIIVRVKSLHPDSKIPELGVGLTDLAHQRGVIVKDRRGAIKVDSPSAHPP